MKDLEQTISRIRNGGKGLWGFECPEGAKFNPEVFLEDDGIHCAVEFIFVRDGSGGRYFEAHEMPIEVGLELKAIAMRGKKKACERGVEKVRIVITEFHMAREDEQYDILREARRIQESERSVGFQFIVCGRWSHYLSKTYHGTQYGSSTSPPTDSKNAYQISYATEEEILAELCSRAIIGRIPTDLDRIGCAFLLEQTGGDWFLIQQAVEAVERVGSSPWTDSIEQIVGELESSPEVFEEATRRLRLARDGARTELLRLLRTRRLLRPVGSNEAEILWLAGLVRKTRVPGGNLMLEIASPVIDAVIRNHESCDENYMVALSREICYCRNSIAMAAYRRVAELENLLRSVIVAEWRLRYGNEWSDRLADIKTRAHDHEELEERIRSLLRKEYNIEPNGLAQASSNNGIAEISPKRKSATVLASARDWQQRQRENHAVDLQNDNIMHFLTTESLIGIFESKASQFHGDGQMFKKAELLTAMAEYAAIRSAVAHNQPIKMSMITKLDALFERFVKWLTVHVDKLPA